MPVAFSKAATIGRHHSSWTVQYTTSSPCAAAAKGMAKSSAASRARGEERTIATSSDSLCGYSYYRCESSAKRRIGRKQRVAGHKAVAREEIAGSPAGFAHEHDARRAVPGVDVQLAIRLDAAGRDVGEAQRAGPRTAHRAARLQDAIDQRHVV